MLKEIYGRSPALEVLKLIKRWNKTDLQLKVKAYAAFIKERLRKNAGHSQ